MTSSKTITVRTCDRCKKRVDDVYNTYMQNPMLLGAIVWNENHELCAACQGELAEWLRPSVKRRCVRGLQRLFSPVILIAIFAGGGR